MELSHQFDMENRQLRSTVTEHFLVKVWNVYLRCTVCYLSRDPRDAFLISHSIFKVSPVLFFNTMLVDWNVVSPFRECGFG